MDFIEAYKRLEKLCGEVLDDEKCVSAYIDEMLNTSRGSYLISGWDDDLKRLKHYRLVRNQIVHEPNCTEQDMCEPYDVEWLTEFRSRIMKQNDPLALYLKATKNHKTENTKQIHKTKPTQPLKPKKTTTLGNFLPLLLWVIVIVIFITLILKHF